MDIIIAERDSLFEIIFPRGLPEGENFVGAVPEDKIVCKIKDTVVEIPAQPFVGAGDKQGGLSRLPRPEQRVGKELFPPPERGKDVPEFF